MDLKNYIREIKDFPIKWIWFKDITPILQNPEAFEYCINKFAENIWETDVIVWLDARWFLFAWALSYKLWKPLVIIRKKWKLPYDSISVDYELEYSKNTFEIHTDSIKKWQKIAIIDDLLATWWTALASCQLVEKLWWIVDSVNFVVDLTFLDWKQKLGNYKINSLIEY